MNRRHALLAAALLPLPALAQAPAITIEAPWTRAAGQGMQGAGYLVIRNAGAQPDRLVAASTPAAQRVELHTHIREGEVMRMRPVADIAVPASGSVALQPGGLHLMLMGLTRALNEGESVPVTLRFERAGEITVELAVRAAGARGGAGHGGGH
ncbi:MAG: copper chaperone PCu(A)C, partial [Acetobacteraceae bacterium]|nr:copper chaperone PCu(A)C [Acetobacteraceae bacterium]